MQAISLSNGDRVRVARKVTTDARGCIAHWTRPMDALVGCVGVYKGMGPDDEAIVMFGSGAWLFPLESLELAE